MKKNEPVQLGTRRELFWDDFIVEQTDAALTQHQPSERGIALVCDSPWEGSGCGYPVVIRDRDVVRLYYKAGNFNITSETQKGDPLTGPLVICCAESYDDGRTFIKPSYGIYEYEGSRDNNIILMEGGDIRCTDNFAVFKDTNPDCPAEERYKAVFDNGKVSPEGYDRILCYMKSADGVHFSLGGEIVRGGWFDSMNCAFWDQHSGQYFLYMRDWPEGYGVARDAAIGRKKRDVRYSTSPDFRNWSEPRRVDFGVDDEMELYTNGIKPYPRADHLFLGLSTRYVEKLEWSSSFDHLPNLEHRRDRSRQHLRYGTALTDCVLLTSRDGVHFKRWDEAFMRPGVETGYNWLYGDLYVSWGLVETPSDLPDMAPNELSFYAFDSMWQKDCKLRRYAIRKDGLISYQSPLKGATLTTKPFVHSGVGLTLNFATSAVGHIRVTLLDEEGRELPGFTSHEVFGDSLDRPVVFEKGTDVSSLAGRPIRMRLQMRDADVFSFQFVSPTFE